MFNSPNLDILKKLSNMDDSTDLYQIFNYLINALKTYLNLDVINKKVKIHVIDEINGTRDSNTKYYSFGINRSIIDDTYYILNF